MFSTLTLKRLRVVALGFVLCMAWMPVPARAQLNTFSSGSTGADGAFAPAANQTIQVPESGVFNFTTINIPGSLTITFTRNSKNSPVTILATGDVTIAGTISVAGGSGLVNGGGGRGGPGGHDGGAAGFGFDTFVGATGDGPGGGGGGGYAIAGITGGAQNANSLGGLGGAKYGSSTILPLIGGSGGGGGGAVSGNHGGAGGGGGGAILIASSTNINFTNFTGSILSLGGAGVVVGTAGAAGGGGSGGAIRLIANTITGGGTINVSGGNAGGTSSFPGGGNGAPGFVRIEAFNFNGFNPNVPTNSATFALPNPITVPSAPSLRIASVAGVAAPATPLGSLAGVPDIVVPSTTVNPVTVAIEAANVPVGTIVQVTLIPVNGARVSAQTGPLAGTQSASTSTASLSLPSGMSVLTASAVVDISQQAMWINGERVDRIEVAATCGGPSEVIYVTRSGRRITSTQ